MFAVEFSRSHARMKWPALALLAVALLLSAACSSNDTAATTPVTPTKPTGPATETLTGTMAPNGTVTRTFTASTSGSVTVTFASASPLSNIILGLGIGIHGPSGADCNFTQTVNTPPGSAPQISISVDAGTYCAGLYDIGNIGLKGTTVSVTIVHP
jgi:hypothetical protein